MTLELREVTADEFFARVGKMDVGVSAGFFPKGEGMYTLFKDRGGLVVGRIDESKDPAQRARGLDKKFYMADMD